MIIFKVNETVKDLLGKLENAKQENTKLEALRGSSIFWVEDLTSFGHKLKSIIEVWF